MRLGDLKKKIRHVEKFVYKLKKQNKEHDCKRNISAKCDICTEYELLAGYIAQR